MSDDKAKIRELQALVDRHARELEEARQAAEAASRAKSAFIANLSHEIRTPMNAIVGLTWMLHEQATDPDQKARLQQVSNATQQLLAVINDLLDISRIESELLTLEALDFDLRQVINHIVSNHAGKATQKGLGFLVDLPAKLPALLHGDPIRLGQILSNFVSNAIKFTASGSVKLRIELKAGQVPEQIRLYCAVEDTGTGLPPEQHQRLFRPFEQADPSTKRRFGGTGLGLAICKRLADMMGGDIGVQSEVGQGSIFWAEIPLTVATSATVTTKPLSLADHGKQAADTNWQQVREALLSLERLLAEDDIQALVLWREMTPLLQPALGEDAIRLSGELHAYSFDRALEIVRKILDNPPLKAQ